MQVRTNIGALFIGATLCGAMSLADVGDGHYTDAPAQPAFSIGPMKPNPNLAAFHRIPTNAEGQPLSEAAISPPAPESTPLPTSLSPSSAPSSSTLDSYVWEALRAALAFLVVFTLAHLALRKARICGRWPYAIIGSAAVMAAIASLMEPAEWRHLLGQGNLSEYVGINLVAGAIIGFLYHWRAGLEAGEDDPAALARALGPSRDRTKFIGVDRTPQPAETDARVSDDGTYVDTGPAEYFNGPVQVRTSFPVMFVAALVSAGAYTLLLFGLGFAGQTASHFQAPLPFLGDFSSIVRTQAAIILGTGLITALPFTFLLLVAHLLIRSLNNQSYLAYCAGGFLAPILLGLLAGPIGVILGLQGAFPMAIAMCTYRSMAGLEPKPVREDIILNDRRNLVGADHARRQFGRLVKN